MAAEIVVRDARPEDNTALIELDRQCVMGGAIQLVFDRFPDFFARSRAYEGFRLCVAEARGTIVGVGGVTIKNLQVNGTRDRWAYFYDLRVHPNHRRRGVAGQIADVLGESARATRAVGAYSLVLEGNVPSEMLVERRGSLPFKKCTLALLSGAAGPGRRPLEPITEIDDEVTSLLEETYTRYDFTPSWDPVTLNDTLGRLAGVGWQGLYGRRARGSWAMCLGLWDYSRVMQVTFRNGGTENPIRPFFLHPLGWRDRVTLAEGLEAARSMIPGGTLLLPYVPGSPLSAVIPRDALHTGMTMYVRGLAQEKNESDRLVFIDPADL